MGKAFPPEAIRADAATTATNIMKGDGATTTVIMAVVAIMAVAIMAVVASALALVFTAVRMRISPAAVTTINGATGNQALALTPAINACSCRLVAIA